MKSSYNNSPYKTGSILKNKNKKKIKNIQLNDYMDNYSLQNNLSYNEKHLALNNNPYTNYLNFSNIDNIKKAILKTDTDYLVNNISECENLTDRTIHNHNKQIKSNFYINNNFYTNNKKYIKRMNTDKDNTFEENSDIHFIKKDINKKELNNHNNNNCYVHKSLKHKNIQNKYLKVNISTNNANFKSSNVVPKENIVGRTESDVKIKSNINIYGRKNIRVNTLKNKKKTQNLYKIYKQEKRYNRNELSKVNVVQINIKKTVKNKFNGNTTSIFFPIKSYENSPRAINNEKINKIYYNNGQKNINNNKKNGIKIKANNNLNNNKLVFNNEEEILYYIKKRYNNNQIGKLFNEQENHMEKDRIGIEKENKYFNSLASDEGNKIIKKNEELFEQIKQLIDENKQYKKELNDIKTKFNFLSKEVLTLKEKK